MRFILTKPVEMTSDARFYWLDVFAVQFGTKAESWADTLARSGVDSLLWTAECRCRRWCPALPRMCFRGHVPTVAAGHGADRERFADGRLIARSA
jgi:hypothetical protein